MTALAVLAAAVATAVAGRSSRPARTRLEAVLSRPSRHPDPPSPVSSRGGGVAATGRSWRRLIAAAVSVVAGGVMIAGPSGIVAGAVGAVVVVMVPARGGAARLDPDQVPVVVDLVSGCLSAGSTLPDALDAAAVAGDEVLALACRSIAGSLRSGVPADVAWSDWLEDPWLGPVARTAVRTAHSGAAAAEDFRRTASRLRARRRAAAEHKVRQAAVWLVAPLGLCFLPAFVLLAVVPLVAGLLPSLR